MKSRSKSWHTRTKPSLIKKFGSEAAWKAHLSEIGKMGNAAGDSKKRGFAASPERASRAGKIGGAIGRIGNEKLSPEEIAAIKGEHKV